MPDKKKIILYGHAGAYNHGAEAITSSTIKILRQLVSNCQILLSTHFAQQDREFKIDADRFIERNINEVTNEGVYAQTLSQIDKDSICIHVGGDNYCYKNWQRYATIHKKAVERNAISILWGCSIEPDMIDDEMLDVLKTHNLITARENITYHSLIQHGLNNVTKVTDIAFSLESTPTSFYLDNYIIINLSPLVVHQNPVIIESVKQLVSFILSETDMNVVLLPHCLISVSNDCDVLSQFDIDKEERILFIPENMSASQYKYIISHARFGVFSRTHAAIAAYSSEIPTLALGYSVKSRGIAGDLGLQDYTVDIKSVDSSNYLLPYFIKMLENETEIHKRLAKRLPDYLTNIVSKQFLDLLR